MNRGATNQPTRRTDKSAVQGGVDIEPLGEPSDPRDYHELLVVGGVAHSAIPSHVITPYRGKPTTRNVRL